ncbi:MAG: NAD(P)-dependent oxidoreductase [Lachnospiraceae bacterium]|nr:NAD(P)-dependent oxidoreductase [Lachnospiraceae bacterium]
MRIVITGPTGAIGIALIKQCIARQTEVLAICHKGGRLNRIPASPFVRVLELNLEEYGSYEPDADIRGYDVFYHFAWGGTVGDARNNLELQHKNIGYAVDAVHLAQKLSCHTFIGAGSQAEYGRVEGKLSADTPTFPENGYGIAKLCAGQMTRLACRQLGMKHIWTRILSVYGPYDGEKTMIISAIRKLLDGEKPAFTKGGQQWDYLYCDDAARAMMLLGEKGKDGAVYCLGSGRAQPLSDYITMLRDAVDSRLELALGEIPYAAGQVMYLCADIGRLQADTGFTPEVDFQTGILQTVEWVKNNKG